MKNILETLRPISEKERILLDYSIEDRTRLIAINEKARNGLSLDKFRTIAENIQMRGRREVTPEKVARIKADELYPHIRDIGVNITNHDQIAERVLAHKILNDEPIPFVGFWGVGEKEHPDQLDKIYMDELAAIVDYVGTFHQTRAEINILLASTHGLFNGFPPGHVWTYLAETRKLLEIRGIKTQWLEDLYNASQMSPPNDFGIVNDSETYDVFTRNREHYEESAKYHHNGHDTFYAGYNYVAMRLGERKILRDAYPNHFLLVNGNKQTSEPLLPHDMSILYLARGPVWFKNGPLEG